MQMTDALTQENAIQREKDGQFIQGIEHEATANHIATDFPFWRFHCPNWLKVVVLAGQIAEGTANWNGIGVLGPANTFPIRNCPSREASVEFPEFEHFDNN
jgi:hypothetical protein